MTQPETTADGPLAPALPARLGGDSGAKILIVDDAQFLSLGLARALRTAGFEPICASSGEMAVRLVQTQPVDIVLTDLRMGGMSGEQLLSALFKLRPQIRCIVMTGYPTREVIEHVAYIPNVAGVLVKPLDYTRLFATLARALGRTAATPEDSRFA